MASQEPFDREMEALSQQVGRFVLRVLKAEEGTDRLSQGMADEIGNHLKAQKYQFALREHDVQLINQVIREMQGLQKKLPTLSGAPGAASTESGGTILDTFNASAASGTASTSVSTGSAGDGGPIVAQAESPAPGDATGEARPGRAWLPRWLKRPGVLIGSVAAVLIIAAAVGAVVIKMRSEPADATAQPAAAESTREAQWNEVLQIVGTWPEARATEARRVLCGEAAGPDSCPTASQRETALAAQPAERAQAAAVIAEAMAEARCGRQSEAGATSRPGGDQAAPLAAAPWNCLMGTETR